VSGFFHTYDPEYPDTRIEGVSLLRARKMRWDYVMATVQDNQYGFHRFAMEQGARYLYQVGNTGQQVDWSLHPFALVSSEVPIVGTGIRYHQEMDPVYAWQRPRKYCVQRIKSFTNFATVYECWPTDLALWGQLSDFHWYMHGGGMPDGVLKPSSRIADAMQSSGWALHDKPTGDGFGHVLWGWAAVGRPLIGHARHYKGKLGEVLWQDMVTCIDLDQHSVEDAAGLIREISEDWDRYFQMCKAIRVAFEEHYDPDRDAERIAYLLGA
jgi:hypothetical protein